MAMRGYEVAQKYVRYRYKRELTRKSNTTDNGILSLLDNINEEAVSDHNEDRCLLNHFLPLQCHKWNQLFYNCSQTVGAADKYEQGNNGQKKANCKRRDRDIP